MSRNRDYCNCYENENRECNECEEFERCHLGKAIKELRKGLRNVEKSSFKEGIKDIKEGMKDIEEGLEDICEGLDDIFDDECEI